MRLDYCRRLSILTRKNDFPPQILPCVILTLVESHLNLEWELHCGTSKRRSRALSSVTRWAVSSLLSHQDRSCPHQRQGRQLQSKSLRPRPLHGSIWRMPSSGKRRRTGKCKSAQRTPRERKTPLHPTQSHSHPHSQRLLREGTRCVHPSQPLWHQAYIKARWIFLIFKKNSRSCSWTILIRNPSVRGSPIYSTSTLTHGNFWPSLEITRCVHPNLCKIKLRSQIQLQKKLTYYTTLWHTAFSRGNFDPTWG